MIYTIKPLEWNEEEGLSIERQYLVAWTPFGYYEITSWGSRVVLETPTDLEFTADSVEHAKELAWKDWTKRLEGALIPCVIATSQSPALMTTSLLQVPPDEKTLKQIERVFADSAFYTNDLNP